jgi:hypothetical protein
MKTISNRTGAMVYLGTAIALAGWGLATWSWYSVAGAAVLLAAFPVGRRIMRRWQGSPARLSVIVVSFAIAAASTTAVILMLNAGAPTWIAPAGMGMMLVSMVAVMVLFPRLRNVQDGQ